LHDFKTRGLFQTTELMVRSLLTNTFR